jgi:hypothetical protein
MLLPFGIREGESVQFTKDPYEGMNSFERYNDRF